jgi:RNase P subunit RPR2
VSNAKAIVPLLAAFLLAGVPSIAGIIGSKHYKTLLRTWWRIEIRKISERQYEEQMARFKEATDHLSAMTGTLEPLREIMQMVEPRQASQFLKLWESSEPYVSLSQSWRLSYCTRCLRAIKSCKTLTVGEGEVRFVHWECPNCNEIDAIMTTQLRLERVPSFGTQWYVREVDGVLLVNILREPICNPTGPWFIEAGADERSINAFVEALAMGSQLSPNQSGEEMFDTDLILSDNSSRLLREANLILTESTSPFRPAAHQVNPGVIS